MSRGPGWLQRDLMFTIRSHGKPMTFEDIRSRVRQCIGIEQGYRLRPSFERSARRALHSMVRDKVLIVLGAGGPGDLFRYFLHPLLIGFMADATEARALLRVLDVEADAPAPETQR